MKKRTKTVSDRIRGRMTEEKITVKYAANMFRVTERTWVNWMKDHESRISIGRLRVIAAMLHTTPAMLLGEEA